MLMSTKVHDLSENSAVDTLTYIDNISCIYLLYILNNLFISLVLLNSAEALIGYSKMQVNQIAKNTDIFVLFVLSLLS